MKKNKKPKTKKEFSLTHDEIKVLVALVEAENIELLNVPDFHKKKQIYKDITAILKGLSEKLRDLVGEEKPNVVQKL